MVTFYGRPSILNAGWYKLVHFAISVQIPQIFFRVVQSKISEIKNGQNESKYDLCGDKFCNDLSK